ncbi:DUF3429 domain-containing protein [Alishewanella tabrizica]|uniref:DUF3429 domain-containing protein n=1 Tax=Alishewanella tabrizica TaxID=671278 RepID=A0ABQ2WD29_9ALTE|nr:DUF3429 domain-containing protein [Alishewanella tabrizica]GGW49354.1 hypothetical protein GCM10008111_01360 [Alishewanella tabrizica]
MLHLLGYSGLLPFILLPLCSLIWPLLAPAQALLLFQFYSCLILGFMAGVLWPVLYKTSQPDVRALWAVSFPVLAIIGIALLPAYVLILLAVLFVALRAYEYLSDINALYAKPYQRLRNHLTVVVVLCHLLFYVGYAYV